jgi:DNA-binding transcriptional LysR family regulator
MNWDDLRYVLAVHRAGSVAGAGRALKVSNVTVFRRIECIERDLGARLFDRKRNGYVPTAVAEEFVRQAAQVEEQIIALERRVWRKDSEVQGSVRITATDTISAYALPRVLAKLASAHPQLRIELNPSVETLNLARRDADIAIRHTLAPPEMLIGHRLVRVAYAVYGAKALASQYRRHRDFKALPWVSPEPLPTEYPFIKWIRDHGCEGNVVMQSNSWLPLGAAVKAGTGIGIVACFAAHALGGLVRLTPPIRELEYAYWILTHPELRNVARVATVYADLRAAFAEMQAVFTGED